MVPGANKVWEMAEPLLRELSLGQREMVGKLLDGLRQQRPLALIFLMFANIETLAGVRKHKQFSHLLGQIQEALERIGASFFPSGSSFLVKNLWNGSFLFFLSFDQSLRREELHKLSAAFALLVEEKTGLTFLRLGGQKPEVQVGAAFLHDKAGQIEEIIRLALLEASVFNLKEAQEAREALLEEFEALLGQEKLAVDYEPIVSLTTGQPVGWEARLRARGPTYLMSQELLLALARETGHLRWLEGLYYRLVLEEKPGAEKGQKLFLLAPVGEEKDESFLWREVTRWWEGKGMRAANLVLILEEPRCLGQLPVLRQALEQYKAQGFSLALRSWGMNPFSLLSDFSFQFLKLEPSLTAQLHLHPRKRALLEAIVAFAQKLKCSLIAEGITDEKELLTLVNLRVEAAQGPLLRRLGESAEGVEHKIVALAGKSGPFPGSTRGFLAVGRIAESTVLVGRNTLVREVKKIFEDDESLDGVVVVEEGRPVGLVMRYNLDRYLGLQYGVPLYFERPISVLMDTSFLAVEEDTPIEVVSQLAMSRERLRLYDWIVVTRNRLFRGVVSVQALLDAFTRIQLEMARGANPLTGLPGRVGIERELLRRAEVGEECAVVFLDLDHFKSYNDKYGFEKGDRVILLVANLLRATLKRVGDPEGFIGHIGGDDFIVITRPEMAEEFCKQLVARFDRLIKRFYSPEDRLAGGIRSFDRSGRETFFPFVTVSLVIVDQVGSAYGYDIKKIAEKAAELKKQAKLFPHSVYLRDKG
ncbi:EAL domain-containing protein [Ammonifex thiophilus]|uniref:EAL domain-containing protein n=1 Tax=Ammonifex thiophilus TaxID=444093 RepID=A0A3D8P3Y8_9THEO|nr:EAL domain-containing protein [Ammonifex thiophilus]RDV83648.1 EAL domain-containing protein [Ammonifex thiophilus]